MTLSVLASPLNSHVDPSACDVRRSMDDCPRHGQVAGDAWGSTCSTTGALSRRPVVSLLLDARPPPALWLGPDLASGQRPPLRYNPNSAEPPSGFDSQSSVSSAAGSTIWMQSAPGSRRLCLGSGSSKEAVSETKSSAGVSSLAPGVGASSPGRCTLPFPPPALLLSCPALLPSTSRSITQLFLDPSASTSPVQLQRPWRRSTTCSSAASA